MCFRAYFLKLQAVRIKPLSEFSALTVSRLIIQNVTWKKSEVCGAHKSAS